MELSFTDELFEHLPPPSSLSTLPSEGSLDDIHSLRQTNEFLRKELERMGEQYRLAKKIADQQADKDKEIELLRSTIEELVEERDNLNDKVNSLLADSMKHKPVANPLQTALVNHLVGKGVVKSKEVEEIMRSIDRGDFSPKEPYVDRPQQLGFNTTISAPHMHATQLEILRDVLHGAKRALDIGTGSGYVALSLAKMMTGDDIKVFALDHVPNLVEQAKENIKKNHSEYISSGKIEFVVADGREGYEKTAPYDIIFVGGAVRTIPEPLIEQLAPGGSMLIPVGEFYQLLTIVHKTKSGKIEQNPVMSVLFGKLQSVEEQCPDIDE